MGTKKHTINYKQAYLSGGVLGFNALYVKDLENFVKKVSKASDLKEIKEHAKKFLKKWDKK